MQLVIYATFLQLSLNLPASCGGCASDALCRRFGFNSQNGHFFLKSNIYKKRTMRAIVWNKHTGGAIVWNTKKSTYRRHDIPGIIHSGSNELEMY